MAKCALLSITQTVSNPRNEKKWNLIVIRLKVKTKFRGGFKQYESYNFTWSVIFQKIRGLVIFDLERLLHFIGVFTAVSHTNKVQLFLQRANRDTQKVNTNKKTFCIQIFFSRCLGKFIS